MELDLNGKNTEVMAISRKTTPDLDIFVNGIK